MAYDHKLKARIESMGAGDLIHTMLAEFDKRLVSDDPETDGPFLQSTAYYQASERLNAIFAQACEQAPQSPESNSVTRPNGP